MRFHFFSLRSCPSSSALSLILMCSFDPSLLLFFGAYFFIFNDETALSHNLLTALSHNLLLGIFDSGPRADLCALGRSCLQEEAAGAEEG